MLADAAEAAVRSLDRPASQEVDEIVTGIVESARYFYSQF